MHGEIEQLYREHYNALRHYVLRLCPNAEFVDDVVQSAFLQAVASIESFRGNSSLQTWLFSIARHELYRHLRKNHVHVRLEDAPETTSDADPLDGATARSVMRSIDALSAPLRTIVRLRLLDGLSFKEISSRVGKTETNCRVSFFRAKSALREESGHDQL